MNKISIKVVKRKDAEVLANAKTRSAFAPKHNAPVNEEKVKRHLRRQIVETISNWIPEREKNKRIEEIAAIRKFFGSETLLSEI